MTKGINGISPILALILTLIVGYNLPDVEARESVWKVTGTLAAS